MDIVLVAALAQKGVELFFASCNSRYYPNVSKLVACGFTRTLFHMKVVFGKLLTIVTAHYIRHQQERLFSQILFHDCRISLIY